ncbi:hypothetical protein IFM89_038369 [Coptis chinensis]|uniref:non-specific serine/threonine protein kinase n=1 Tax=Coptis chinensis TaxID=261450 RepID=A0A835H2X3_9MAGN|nr:hypothetical protein IFM89_038369 [Coptis chinensis]
MPSTLGTLYNLTLLDLSYNKLNGSIPKELGDLSQLKWLRLSGNSITGELPRSFKNLTILEDLVRGTLLSGKIPDFIADWSNLKILRLMGSNFEGPLPSGILALSGLKELWVSDLVITTNFSFPSMSQLTAMTSLILRNCSIDDKIPESISNLSLIDLDLSFNKLNGEIPTFRNLKSLCLTRNRFNGSIPNWIQNSVEMDFSYNNFTNATVLQQNKTLVNSFDCCSSKSNTTSIMQLMNDQCPHGKSNYSSLYLNCGGEGTHINGDDYDEDSSTLPFKVSQKGNWAYTSSGDFITSIANPRNNTVHSTCGISVPAAPLYSTARISALSLDYYGLCFRNGIYNVTLHFAEIVYADDDDYSSLGERVKKDFNVKAEANGPKKPVTRNFTANVTNNLLHIQFYWAGKGITLGLYGPLISAISVTSEQKPGRKLSSFTIAIITVASSLAIILVSLAIIWKLGLLGHKDLRGLEGEALKKKYTFQNIVDATQNFSSKKEIGCGGSATVYKADMQDGSVLAVKKLPARSIKGHHEFVTEVRTLEALKGENLVQLLGWYTGDEQLLLIYQYMENNSLYHALFAKNGWCNNAELTLELGWATRYKICEQIADGLVYLHSQAQIIHRDIKTSNILLDKDFNAKISDFGLAKFFNEEQNNVSTKLRGTHGYMAPEYATRGVLSVKTDVYSYGVVILEIVTGKSNALYNSSQESEFLLDEAYVLQSEGNILDLIDESVKHKADYSVKEASTVLKLAMLCTNLSATLRPTMSQVLSVLKGEKIIEEISAAKQLVHTNDLKHCKSCVCTLF